MEKPVKEAYTESIKYLMAEKYKEIYAHYRSTFIMVESQVAQDSFVREYTISKEEYEAAESQLIGAMKLMWAAGFTSEQMVDLEIEAVP